jgi:hypothetical protein
MTAELYDRRAIVPAGVLRTRPDGTETENGIG